MKLFAVQSELRALGSDSVAHSAKRYIKTGKGQYGENDRFIGVRVPVIRSLAKRHANLSLPDMLSILKSEFHEERLLALIMMVHRFSKSTTAEQKQIYNAYLKHTRYINGWDLVDSSAYQIVGAYLFDKDRGKLRQLAESGSLWERRIAIVATYQFIKHDQFQDTLDVAEKLLTDKEDLIHKAVGWMLREVGNRDRAVEENFLARHYRAMPRTMLRYAIEKFAESDRQAYLIGKK